MATDPVDEAAKGCPIYPESLVWRCGLRGQRCYRRSAAQGRLIEDQSLRRSSENTASRTDLKAQVDRRLPGTAR